MVVSVPNEKISLLEAIGMAGDLTLFARRDNVLLIREEKGKRLLKRINLNSGDIFNSPYYYLKSNDIIYAEPNKSKVFGTSGFRAVLPLGISLISVLTLVVYRLLRF
jgi:polysaccharide export outer membrane protein